MAARRYDAVVVGSGPNGLSAAIKVAQAGRSVLVIEAEDMPGGGARTAELTLPGFQHDICSAVHPLGIGSPFFRTLPLQRHALEWVQPPAALAHPFDDGTALLLERSLDATARQLGPDGDAYARLMGPLVARWLDLYKEVLGPIHIPTHPLLLAKFGPRALLPTTWLTRLTYKTAKPKALFAGIAAHCTVPLNQPPSAAFGFILSIAAHAVGWPIARGGSGCISRALISYLKSLGGELITGRRVESWDDIPPARVVFLDLTPAQVLRIAGERLPPVYRGQLRHYQHGLGTFKVDWALDAPIPWRAPECARSATVHLGGTMEEIAQPHYDAWEGKVSERPFVLLAQPTLFDASRAPEGKHIAWAYCHLPNGCEADMAERIEAQVERFAPGFRERIIGRSTMTPAQLERKNANLRGGDINLGEANLAQLVTRPAMRIDPYATPLPELFLCSSSTPPGGGVHGMCGYQAARSALRRRLTA